MKIRIPSKTVCACDICERESASSLLDKCVVCGREYCCTCRAIMCGCVHQPDVCKKCGDNEAVRAAVETFAPRISRVLDARDVVLSGLGAVALKASDRKRKSANDSSSETAEGGGGLAQPVPNGGAQESRPESADAPDAEAQAVTDRSRPERFSAAPLLAIADDCTVIVYEPSPRGGIRWNTFDDAVNGGWLVEKDMDAVRMWAKRLFGRVVLVPSIEAFGGRDAGHE